MNNRHVIYTRVSHAAHFALPVVLPPGDVDVGEDVPGRVVLRLVGFDPVTTIFCRRQTGGLRKVIALAGGEGARVRHVRCCIEGDDFCEWELSWQVENSTAGVRSAT